MSRRQCISIHSPYTGRDGGCGCFSEPCRNISIHSPYTGRDEVELVTNNLLKIFQSTLPIQGETGPEQDIILKLEFQSTLPIQGETDGNKRKGMYVLNFNPLSLYRERQSFLFLHNFQ